jgi:hypothetical protein
MFFGNGELRIISIKPQETVYRINDKIKRPNENQEPITKTPFDVAPFENLPSTLLRVRDRVWDRIYDRAGENWKAQKNISRRGAEDAETHSFLIVKSINTSSASLFFSAFLCDSSDP